MNELLRSFVEFGPDLWKATLDTFIMVGATMASAVLLGTPLGVSIQGPDQDRWVLRAEDRDVLLDLLASVDRPPGQLRLQVDPARI